MNERNENIRKCLEAGRQPLLDFELSAAKASLEKCTRKQRALCVSLRESMQQSSETWHDNAPADAVVSDSRVLTGVAEKLIGIIDKAEVFNMPNNEDESVEVTLGSSVTVELPSGTKKTLLLTGATPKEESTGIDCVTLQSPLGAAILGGKAGEAVEYTVGARKLKVMIRKIENNIL